MKRGMRMALVLALGGCVLFAVASAGPASERGDVGATLQALQAERSALAEALMPSVVAVASTRPDMSRRGDAAGGGMSRSNASSGFVVDGRYVITCMEGVGLTRAARPGEDQFLQPGVRVWMMSHDGTEFSGEVIGRDRRNLLLVIRMDEGHPDLPSLKLGDSDAVSMGSTAVGLGNTLDSMIIDRTVSFSYGTVSGFYRFEPVDVIDPADFGDPYKGNVLEVDVAIHSGDHGGPLVNLDGEVIGMMTGHYMAGRHLGCAVPINQIRAVLTQLKKGVAEDDLAQGWLGFVAGVRENDTRIYINRVDADGPAEKAGIVAGMELLRVDNYRIPGFNRLREMLGAGFITRARQPRGMFDRPAVDVPVSYGVPVGTRIQLTVRDPGTGEERTVDLMVGEREENF
jgi:serine protease Do